MADNLRWLTVSAFPGVDTSTVDQLIQPPSHGPAVMRRMIGVDPFSSPGLFQKAPTFTLITSDSHITKGFGQLTALTVQTLYRVANSGRLYQFDGAVWEQVTSSKFPIHSTNRVRMCVGNNALFLVDGHGRPKVLGWNYDAGDQTVEWDTQHVVADILYTAQHKTSPTASADDFAAEGCCFHAGRLVLWKGNLVRMSGPNKPTTFYDANNAIQQLAWFYVAENDGLPITNAISFENQMLVVGKPKSLHGYIGSDPATAYSRIVLDADLGVWAPDSLCVGSGRVWFCSHIGPCFMDPKSGVKDEPSRAIASVWATMTDQQKRDVVGWFSDGRYHIVLPIKHPDVSGTIPEDAYARYSYDPTTRRWAQAWGAHGIHTRVESSESSTRHYTASGGKVYQQLIGSSLMGNPVVQELITPWIEFNFPWSRKWIRAFRFAVSTSSGSVSVEYGIDGSEAWSPMPFEQPPALGVWREAHDPLCEVWRTADDVSVIRWSEAGLHTVKIASSVHCQKLRLRIRGENMMLSSFAIGFDYKGV